MKSDGRGEVTSNGSGRWSGTSDLKRLVKRSDQN